VPGALQRRVPDEWHAVHPSGGWVAFHPDAAWPALP
jgi:hypothetical protein